LDSNNKIENRKYKTKFEKEKERETYLAYLAVQPSCWAQDQPTTTPTKPNTSPAHRRKRPKPRNVSTKKKMGVIFFFGVDSAEEKRATSP
jgi:hypothetical protein